MWRMCEEYTKKIKSTDTFGKLKKDRLWADFQPVIWLAFWLSAFNLCVFWSGTCCFYAVVSTISFAKPYHEVGESLTHRQAHWISLLVLRDGDLSRSDIVRVAIKNASARAGYDFDAVDTGTATAPELNPFPLVHGITLSLLCFSFQW